MNRRKVRCYIAYADAGGIFNNEVLCLVQEGYRLQLVTCINCGEIFLIDLENPKTKNLSIERIANGMSCPSCSTPLADSLRKYPETFIGRNNKMGSFSPSAWIPPEAESIIVELWEIAPPG